MSGPAPKKDAGNTKSLVIAGAGGNIGSFFSPLAARLPGVGRVVVVDPDRYEEKNLSSQDILPADVGRPKVEVVAERLRAIDPNLVVDCFEDVIANVPMGLLRGDVIAACVDSRLARRTANEIAWRLGVPWVDAAVRPEDLLARVNVYVPEPGLPCIECGWDDRHYESLEFRHACDGEGKAVAATNGPADLGALAAALAALECRKLLRGETEAAGREVLIEGHNHNNTVTRMRHNPHCRFDHRTLAVEPLDTAPGRMTVGDALALPGDDGVESNAIRVPGKRWVTRLVCRTCGRSEPVLYLLERLHGGVAKCSGCGRETEPVGFSIRDAVRPDEMGPGDTEKSLEDLGLLPGDVFTVETATGEVFHFEPAGRGTAAEPRDSRRLEERVV